MHGDKECANGGKEIAAVKAFHPPLGQLSETDGRQQYAEERADFKALAPEEEAEQRDDQHKEVVEEASPGDRRAADADDKHDVCGCQGGADQRPANCHRAVQLLKASAADRRHQQGGSDKTQSHEGDRRKITETDLGKEKAPSPKERAEAEPEDGAALQGWVES